jgi:hypothetical protein
VNSSALFSAELPDREAESALHYGKSIIIDRGLDVV